ncbi:hypothetical protein I547_2857 [Mycobacterium kansasii 824]|nr:hypothetical protein I547_2857 [Mycobacterium kansasii 824]
MVRRYGVRGKADKTELGWRMEVDIDGDWRFFDQTDGDRA